MSLLFVSVLAWGPSSAELIPTKGACLYALGPPHRYGNNDNRMFLVINEYCYTIYNVSKIA